MKKILFLLFFLISTTFASFNLYETTIQSTSEYEGVILDSNDILVGSSGIVIHDFGKNQKSIIARASVIKKDGKNATIKYEGFNLLEQKSFPIPSILPKKGDKVVLNFLYNRSLIIAPNKSIYDEITKNLVDIFWVHPDLVESYFTTYNIIKPTRKNFTEVCNAYGAGLIFFALDGEAFFADCKSFKILKSFETAEFNSKIKLPFYSRLKAPKSQFAFILGEKNIKNFSKYYKSMLVE